ncbi:MULTISPECIES: hypothetical protein [unclassified Pseudomonas]|uniref:hypothetical protein n=1 Tax=unclassified Pseudomonas TaxID=196821 RepID=UPI00117A4FA6|nr:MULTISPECIES: hypothetical protein [unclassified Pseudomonas]
MPSTRLRTLFTVTILVAPIAACTPTIYKDEISAFSKAVDESAAAFTGLHERTLVRHKLLEQERFSEQGVSLGVSDKCNDIVTSQLPRDTQCLADWAKYRSMSESTRGNPPPCPGATNAVKNGELAFYDLTELAKEEEINCRIGIVERGVLNTEAIRNSEVVLTQSLKLVPALRAYAVELTAIAGAEDQEALQSSLVKAKSQIQKLGESIDNLDGKKSPYTATISPISDLIGSALTTTLEYRRARALASIARAADPVVTRTAMILSNVAMPMTAMELQDAGTEYLESFNAGGALQGTALAAAYETSRAARERYLTLYTTSPTPVFKSMAEAHHQLAEALSDPKLQYEAVKTAVEDFSEKAKAAYDAYKNARTQIQEEEKAKAEVEEEAAEAEAEAG